MSPLRFGSDEMLGRLRQKTLVKVYKFFIGENDHIPASLRDQEADGYLYLEFKDGSLFGFYPVTEIFSIRSEELSKASLPSDVVEVSENGFWKKRLPSRILNASFLFSEFCLDPFALRLNLENNYSVEIHYISESKYEFDALIVR